MRTHGRARRSRATWSPRRVSSFLRAISFLRSAIHCCRETTGWFRGGRARGTGRGADIGGGGGHGVLLDAVRDRLSRDAFGAGCPTSGSYKCGGIPVDSLITAAARALAAGDPLGALNRVALRTMRRRWRCAASPWRNWAIRECKNPGEAGSARLRRQGAGGARPLRRRRSRDRAGLARARLASPGARRGPGDARAGGRPAERRPCASPRSPPPVLVGHLDEAERSWPGSTPRRSRRHRGPCTSWCRGHRDAPVAHPAGARGAGPGGPRRATGRHSRAHVRNRKRDRVLDTPAARPWRGAKSVRCGSRRSRRCRTQRAGDGRLPPCRAPRRHDGLARRAAGAVRARARAGRGVARRRGRDALIAKLSAPGMPTTRIARGCGSRSGDCAPSSRRWPTSVRPRRALR